MRAWKNRPLLLRGRLHGRLLKILGGVAVVAAAAAVWQFSILLDGDDDRAGADWDDEDVIAEEPYGSSVPPAADTSVSSSTPEESAEPTPDEPSAPDSSEAPASPSDPEPSGPECTATLRLDGQWSNAVSVTVEVVNTGEAAFDGWEVVLDFDDVEIQSTWGMRHIEGDRYGNGLFNGGLEPGDDTEPSFQGKAPGKPDLPETVPCSPTAP